jgi:hypothetical protein
MHTPIMFNIKPKDKKFEIPIFTQNNTHATTSMNNAHPYNTHVSTKGKVRKHIIYNVPLSLLHPTHKNLLPL